MKKLYLVALFVVIFGAAFAQLDPVKSSNVDSLVHRAVIFNTRIHSKADSTSSIFRLQHTTAADTLRFATSKVDSIRFAVNAKMDSIQHPYQDMLSRIQQSRNSLISKMDSLQESNLPTDKYISKLDSVSDAFYSLQRDLTSKVEDMKSKARKEIDAIPLQPELKEELSRVTQDIDKLGSHSIIDRLPPELQVSQLELDKLQGVPAIPGLPNLNAPGVEGLPNLPAIEQKIPGGIDGLPEVSKAEGLAVSSEKVSNVTGKAGEISQVKSQSVDQLADSKLSNLDQTQQIQKEAEVQDVSSIKSQDALKEELLSQARTMAVDHFAGKEQQLKGAIEKMAEIKKKFPNAMSMTDVTKKRVNAMKGKPPIERIVPGVNLQVQKKGKELMVDFNPYIGYRFTGRITAGLGWNHRVSYNYDVRQFVSTSSIFGPRTFGELRLGKGFCPRLEVEVMSTRVPPATLSSSADPYSRQMVWGVFTGIKKEYNFIGRVKGTATVMVRLFDPKRQSPYADVIGARIGFEFPTRKDGNKN